MKIASSPTKEGLLALINSYYMTENCIITDDDKVRNTKLDKELGYVKKNKKRFEYHTQ